MAFATLYGDNCAACHGADGRLGASRPLNDPLYLALVPRSRIRGVIADGVPGTLQPAFAQSAGGTLTDAQIDALVSGLLERWGGAKPTKSDDIPSYAAPAGSAARGKAVYVAACAGCHGADGKSGQNGGAIADASYLSLVSDQYLRTTVIAGRVGPRAEDVTAHGQWFDDSVLQPRATVNFGFQERFRGAGGAVERTSPPGESHTLHDDRARHFACGVNV